MERSACALFGVVTYGVHMTVYEEDERGVRVWVPTRAKSKPTWPGFLDNSVAGGIPSGMGAFEALVKESMEEASIDADIVRAHATAVGAISYFFQTKDGWLQPEIEFVYDLRVPAGLGEQERERFRPKPLDGEVEAFELLPLDEVLTRMRAGLFKPNCALVIIDFLMRRGFITPDNEPDYMEILTRLHSRFEYERWGELGA
ncbi:LOC733379 protein-like protein [Gloeophyllum trabeum ATCC 11539]|uniref:LOC733379 protein-like protein n=1 Tax=Gloeophyllum trabeum (strain ATCC 11539 / FP-39264 / Madison 617) TaxID=670483 RepID=S7PU46_GLOTA|nr:LOC733379 protein-like protein [Gloeophyllum trabeum ATCC 11539]EPQ50852.1 LOC733379 protein-like protein [Gloeophyllum trabeum ATCC 11539]